MVAKKKSKLANIIDKYPIESLFSLSFIISGLVLSLIVIGILPTSFFVIVAAGASIAGLILAGISGGMIGVKRLLSRLLIWKVSIWWYVFVIFLPAIISLGAFYLFNFFGGPAVEVNSFSPVSSAIPMILFLTIQAGLGEEFGWRGFALPRAQKKYNALITSIIIGTFWTAWHVPMFFVEGVAQYGWVMEVGFIHAVLSYAVYLISFSILLTCVFNNTKGSVLLAALFHGTNNAWIGGYFKVHEFAMGATYGISFLFLVTAIIVVLIYGPENLSRKNKRVVLKDSK